jgi:hypothetical protein
MMLKLGLHGLLLLVTAWTKHASNDADGPLLFMQLRFELRNSSLRSFCTLAFMAQIGLHHTHFGIGFNDCLLQSSTLRCPVLLCTFHVASQLIALELLLRIPECKCMLRGFENLRRWESNKRFTKIVV